MSSKEKTDKGNQQEITRSKQSRRKLLKSLAAGSGAVIAGKATSDQWSKPIVDSVLLPAHAITSLRCTVDFNMSATAAADTILGTYGPGTNQIGTAFGTSNPLLVTPAVSVTPGVTDTFNLTSVFSAPPSNDLIQPDPADLIQIGVTPTANGALVFNAMSAGSVQDDAPTNVTMTLTPDNPSFCGSPIIIDVTFPQL